MLSGLGLGGSGGLRAISSDTQVQGTNDDAQVSKLSCTKQGYFKDDFIHYFVRKASRRSPLINRGYYSRYAGLRQLLLRFLSITKEAGLPSQVIVLGAGFDTTWFQLEQAGLAPSRYLEVDFKEVTKRKVAIIGQQPALMSMLRTANGLAPDQGPAQGPGAEASGTSGSTSPSPVQGQQGEQQGAAGAPGGAGGPMPPPPPRSPTTAAAAAAGGQAGGAGSSGAQGPGTGAGTGADSAGGVSVLPETGEVVSGRYNITPVDLRDLTALEAAVRKAGMDFSAPTYILSECVLVYMDPGESSRVVGWLARTFQAAAAMAIYEQVKPDDAFGRQMVSNLESRGCPLLGLPATPSLEAHCGRLVDNGWSAAASWDMDTLYKTHLDPADKARVEALEVFDEFEEWHMIQEHYCISLGTNCEGGGVSPAGLLTGLGWNPKQASLQREA